jgi:hypothetical protein
VVVRSGDLLGEGVRSRVTEHVATLVHLNRESGPELRDMWWLVVARSAACLVFMLVRGVTRSTGY